MNSDYPTVPAPALPRLDPEVAVDRCREFAETMARRRTVRDFSSDPIPLVAVREAVRAAATAPSGANLQPWRFVVVTDPERKRLLRQGAEEEERAFYASRASEEWRDALAPLGTDWRKPFLDEAPVVIAVMEVHRSEESPRPYYAKESVGIAVGLLLAALHGAGFATLTHTPSPMKWISRVLERPAHERPFALIPVGYPSENARLPDISRKPLADVLTEIGP